MNTLFVLFYISIVVWLLSEIYYKQKFKSDKKDQKKDQSTLNILWLVIIPSVFTVQSQKSTVRLYKIEVKLYLNLNLTQEKQTNINF